jgi:D-threo-aldose 1-dehydrogenase
MYISTKIKLPRSGLELTALGMGCSVIAGLYRETNETDARAAIDDAWDCGIRYFDTAPFYGYTLSEHRVGAALRGRRREDFVLSTKVGRLMVPDATVAPGTDGWAAPLPFRPVYDYTHDGIMRSHADSLQRLGMSYVDILFVHDIGAFTHGDRHAYYWQQLTQGGGFRALVELRDSGQVKAIGLGVNEWQVVRQAMQEAPIDCTLLAGRYTLLEQECLGPLLASCVEHGNSIVIGAPFNSGVLAGKQKFNYADVPPHVQSRVERLAAVCARYDVPLPAAALQFPMAHPAVVSCIPGGRNVEQLRQNARWFEQPIPREFWQALVDENLIDENSPLPRKMA